MKIEPASSIDGAIAVPGVKGISQRAVLVGAIADNELVLHFQPIVNAESGLVDCFEALVRWDRPGFGLLPPDEFLPVAESSDLICQLDTWVLRESVAQLSRWNRLRGDDATMSTRDSLRRSDHQVRASLG